MFKNISIKNAFGLLAIVFNPFTSVVFADDSVNQSNPSNTSGSMWGQSSGSTAALTSAVQNPKQLPNTAMNMAAQNVQSTLIPTIWPTAPEWLKRTEWDAQFNSVNGAQYNVLTTQPLWQSAGKSDTLFVQGSYEHYNLYDIGRNTINGGLGYRKLLLDDQLLLGINNFYDYEISHDHARSSIGVDAKWGIVDAYGNYYYRLNGVKTVAGEQERVNNGYDVGLGLPLPYLPWARVYGRYYNWEGIVAKDTTGGEFSAEFALHPNFTLVAGTRGDEPDNTRHDNYVMLQFHFGGDGKPTLMTEPVSSQMFEPRDLTNDTLDKVRRENRIIVERTIKTSGGITVVVKKG